MTKKNRFAQPMYGKIIYIYETDLEFNQLSTIFSPSTFWIDVTGLDCEVGYLVDFKEGVGLVLTPPPNKEYTFEELKQQKLELEDNYIGNLIIGGFTSSCTGEEVRYDSDTETQQTMTGIAINVDSELFKEKYPNGCPVRGYVGNDVEKSILMLTPEQVKRWLADLYIHVGDCKTKGWILQSRIKACTTKEELDAINFDEVS